MICLPSKTLEAYRQRTFHTLPGQRLKTKRQAVEFVNQRGFVYFWPIKGILFPSLWTAVAGDRPVADAHDDPGHVTWGWKDSLLDQRVWYYAKILRKKATILSLELAPFFYALSENYGAPDEDYLTQYEQGRMTQEAKLVYETILAEGPIDTVALRKAARLTSRESNSPFERALAFLQADFKILPVAVAQAGAWNYAFVYELVPRHYPQVPEQARTISEKAAREELARRYFLSAGAAQAKDLSRLFGWTQAEVSGTLASLVAQGTLLADVALGRERSDSVSDGKRSDSPKRSGSDIGWFALAELLS